MPSGRDRRRAQRVHLDIQLLLSVYQWEQEGAFTGQNIEGTLRDLSENGLQIASKFPLAQDMFVVIHFPKEADLPPITGRIIRVETHPNEFRYGCLLSGLSPYVRVKLEQYIQSKI
nr:PilZ domain-containing protein [Paenibacillus sp. VKM B-2647]